MDEADVAKKIYEIAKERGWLDRLLSMFDKKYNVLVLGSSGVGKTNMLRSLSTITPEIIHYSRRTSDATKTHLKIDSLPFNFIDTPGQQNHSSIRLKTIREVIGNLDVIVNVVCYGYHEFARGKDRAFTDKGDIRKAYISENRRLELAALSEWSEILGVAANCKLITVVSKADLWWHESNEVLDYYETGEYFENLGSCKNLRPVVIHHCSVFHKFYGISPISGLFDEDDRLLSRANLLKTLIEAVGKGGE